MVGALAAISCGRFSNLGGLARTWVPSVGVLGPLGSVPCYPLARCLCVQGYICSCSSRCAPRNWGGGSHQGGGQTAPRHGNQGTFRGAHHSAISRTSARSRCSCGCPCVLAVALSNSRCVLLPSLACVLTAKLVARMVRCYALLRFSLLRCCVPRTSLGMAASW